MKGGNWLDAFKIKSPDNVLEDDFALRRLRYRARRQVYLSLALGILVGAAVLLIPVGAQDWFGIQ